MNALGSLDSTPFQREKLIPFMKNVEAEYGEYLELRLIPQPLESGTMELVVSPKHFRSRQ
jgi:hypothetical protein